MAGSSTTPGIFLQQTNKSIASNKSAWKPTELTANSGYMADSSSARTPGDQLLTKKKAFVNSPSSASQGKKKMWCYCVVFESESYRRSQYYALV